MEYDVDSGAHLRYPRHYHQILTTECRREVLTEERTRYVQEVTSGFTDNYSVELTKLDGEDALKTTLTNFNFIAHETITTDEATDWQTPIAKPKSPTRRPDQRCKPPRGYPPMLTYLVGTR